MSLTPIQYRDIMNEYDQLRRDNYQLQQQRIEEIDSIIPEIKAINDKISSDSISAAKQLLFQPDAKVRSALHEKVESSIHRKRQLLIQHGYPADYLDPIYHCSYCKDTGYVNDQKCFCFEDKIKHLMYQQSNLLDTIGEHNFNRFQINYYSDQPSPDRPLSPKRNILNVLDEVYTFMDKVKADNGGNLLIHGNAGVGKTFLTTCIANEIMQSGKSVIYLTAYQLFEHLADYAFRRKEHPEITLPKILQADLLIIDDLGTEMNNAFVNSQLFLCINERILNKKSTIINTNFSLKQISQTYTERISSRLIQFYTILHIYGEDIRIKKAFSTID